MYSFRPASREDATNIVKLVESAYRGETSRMGWTTEADLLHGQRTDQREVSALIRMVDSEIILCEEQGLLHASVHIKNMGDYAYLGMFAVTPEQQGKGTGKKLLQYIEKKVKETWGCQSIEMTVIKQRKELIQWYQNQGYILTGENRPFPYGDERFGIPQRDDLVLEVLKKQF